MQLGILVASFVAIEFGWQCVYALGGAKLARWLAPANRQRLFNRGTGLIFIGFGGALLGARALVPAFPPRDSRDSGYPYSDDCMKRLEGRRGAQMGDSTCRTRGSPYHT